MCTHARPVDRDFFTSDNGSFSAIWNFHTVPGPSQTISDAALHGEILVGSFPGLHVDLSWFAAEGLLKSVE